MSDIFTPERFLAAYNPKNMVLASDNLKDPDESKRATYRMPREQALTKLFIQTYAQHAPNCMVLDMDFNKQANGLSQPDAMSEVMKMVDKGDMPLPNWVTVNPATGNAQAGLFMDGFFHTEKAKFAFYDAQRRLTAKVGADPAYGGKMERSPLHEYQETYWLAADRLHLDQINAIVPIPVRAKSAEEGREPVKGSIYAKSLPELTGGRHTDTFNSLRVFAYGIRRFHTELPALEIAIRERANELNYSWSVPMAPSEVNQIIRSVTKFVWAMRPEAFTTLQTIRSQKATAKRIETKEQRYKRVLKAVADGCTRAELAQDEKITVDSAKRLIKRSRHWARDTGFTF
jgi:hypothetical protein